MPAYNQLAASSLLNQQYAAALGLGKALNRNVFLVNLHRETTQHSQNTGSVLHAGPVLPGFHVRRGPMVEKAVQTLHVERSMQRGASAISPDQDQWQERRRPQRTRGESFQPRMGTGATSKNTSCSNEKTKCE